MLLNKLTLLLFLFLACTLAHSQETVSKPDVALYWDTSYSMRDRDLAAEISYFNVFFETKRDVTVKLVMLSTNNYEESVFTIVDGNWDNLKKALVETQYDGASYFEMIKPDSSIKITFISTDGQEAISILPKISGEKIIAINSVTEDAVNLASIIKLAGGEYINKKFLLSKPKASTSVSVIKPSVLSESGLDPLSLDEVLLKGKSKDNYVESVQLEIGGLTYSKEKLGYAVSQITDTDISAQDIDTRNAIKGQFSNLEIANDASTNKVDISQFLGRHKNMTALLDQTGLIVVDGVPQGKSDSGFINPLSGIPRSLGISNTINPDNIHSVVYLRGLAATNRYGTLGKGGVIEIITKAAEGLSGTKKNIMLGTTPTYAGNAQEMDALPNVLYINKIKSSADVNEAFSKYLAMREQFGSNPAYYLDMATYFKGYNDNNLVTRILANVTEVANDEISVLNALSYMYEDVGDNKSKKDVQEFILRLTPKRVQSYLDLARSYEAIGAIKDAEKIYLKIDTSRPTAGLRVQGLQPTIDKEYTRFVEKHAETLNMSLISSKFKATSEKLAYRIVVEYSDPSLQFDLKIINPQNRFFTWSHTNAENKQRLIDEKNTGYVTEEFFLTEDDKGNWKFNLINQSAPNSTPNIAKYIKFTTYKNWGSTNEQKTIKVIQLEEIGKESQVISLSI